MPMSKVRTRRWLTASAPSTPAAAARLVTTATSAKRPPIAPRVEPALKPNQPNQSTSTARPTSGMLWPGITLGLPSLPYLPCRGPSSSSAASAPVAPIRCTTVEPAKSCMPKLACSQPPPKIQWLMIG